MIGRVLEERYRLDAELGRGGLGIVYRATHLRLGRPVAVKLMQPEHLGREGLRARFDREARSLAALAHPNVVAITDYGVDGEQPYLVMELLEGRPLDAAIAAGLAPEHAVPIARELLRALAYAHERGIVPSDLKPANVFLCAVPGGGEQVRVLDFGLAKFIGGGESAGAGADASLTRQGSVLGTPAYMAPEQATGGEVGPRADVYATALLLFECVTGRLPFSGSGPELLRQHLLTPFPSLSEARPDLLIQPALEALLARAAAKSPRERWADAREMLAALDAVPAPAIARRDGSAVSIGPLIASPPSLPSPLPSPDATMRDSAIVVGMPMVGVAARGDAVATHREIPARAPSGARPDAEATRKAGRSGARSGHSDAAMAHAVTLAADASHSATDTPWRDEPVRAMPAERSGGRALLAIGLGALVVLGAATCGLGGWLMMSSEPEAPIATPVPPPTPPATPPEPTRIAAPTRSPWADDAPEPLESIHVAFVSGQSITRAQREALRRYASAHEDDARAWLLMAHDDVLAGDQAARACERYTRALTLDPRARVDTHALVDVVSLAARADVGPVAAGLLAAHWGSRAVPALDALRAQGGLDEEADARVLELRQQLASMPVVTAGEGARP